MARIRTVKPEFWEDELVGLLPRDARLLFIATFNLADDEGLLRWTAAYIKASVFMYDDDLTVADVSKLMHCLTDTGLLHPYLGGVARQQMAMVVNFRKHQKINRPQKSKLPPPSLQNPEVRRVYGRRDNWTCRLCGGGIPERPVQNPAHNLAIGLIRPQGAGGTEHPSNVRAVHQACGKFRPEAPDDEFTAPPEPDGLSDSLNESVSDSVNAYASAVPVRADAQRNHAHEDSTRSDISSLNDSLNDSLPHSLLEGKGKEGSREGKGTPQPPAPEPAREPAVVETGRALPDRMTDAFLERFARGNTYGRRQVRRVIADTLANGTDSHELWQALLRLGDTSKPVTANTLQFAFADVRKAALPAAAGAENVIHLPTGQLLPGTDTRVHGWLSLPTGE